MFKIKNVVSGELKYDTGAMRKICIEQSKKVISLLDGDGIQRRILPPIKRNFNIENMNQGDKFLGCPRCFFQFDVGTITRPICPECGSTMNVCIVTKEDKEDSNGSK